MVDDLSDELALNEPRYVLVSYELHHDDGRVSYPYCLIFSSPRSAFDMESFIFVFLK